MDDRLPLSNDEALELNKYGGTILCLDVPEALQFGLDVASFTTGPKFKGVKMIPPGLHLVTHQLGTQAMLGLWVEVKKSDVIVKKWSPSDEEFYPGSGMDEDDAERYRLGVKRYEFDSGLGPYPLQSYPLWQSCTGRINKDTLRRAELAVNKVVVPGESLTREEKAKLNSGTIDANKDDIGLVPVFADLRKQRRKEGMSPAEISKYNMDGTMRLFDYIKSEHNGDKESFLASIELSFILFISLSSLPAFEYWNSVLTTICECDDGLYDEPEFFTSYIKLLSCQLELADPSLFSDEFLGNDILVSSLTAWAEVFLTDTGDLDITLVRAWHSFTKAFQRVFGIDVSIPGDG